jgi:hypothetical protein
MSGRTVTADDRNRGPTVTFLTASGAAERIPGAKPKDISDLIYQRKVDTSRCPVIAGRRLIPPDLLGEIEAALRAAGRLSSAIAMKGSSS